MRQVEILAILKASDRPMTSTEILEAHGIRRNRYTYDAGNVRQHLAKMHKAGSVRKAGYIKGDDGHYRYLWEVVE